MVLAGLDGPEKPFPSVWNWNRLYIQNGLLLLFLVSFKENVGWNNKIQNESNQKEQEEKKNWHPETEKMETESN